MVYGSATIVHPSFMSAFFTASWIISFCGIALPLALVQYTLLLDVNSLPGSGMEAAIARLYQAVPLDQRAGNTAQDTTGAASKHDPTRQVPGRLQMRPRRLRALVDRGGVLGTLLVGGYLVLHHAWHHRRSRLTLSVAGIFLLSGWLVLRHLASRPTAEVPAPRPMPVPSDPTLSWPFGDPLPPLAGPPAPKVASPSKPLSIKGAARYILPGWYPDHEYYWLSDQEVLFFREIPGEDSKYRIVRRNLSTGQERELSRLSALFNGTEGAPTIPVDLSPDRRWFLWYDYVNGLYAARLDGSEYFTFQKSHKDASELWSPDSRSIMAVCTDRPSSGCWMEAWNVKPPHERQRWEANVP